MSELKAYKGDIYIPVYGSVADAKVYLKSEADKVIANLEDELRAANEQIENLINSASSIMLFQDRVNDNKCDELHHQKFKRCLAMVKYCHESAMWFEECGVTKSAVFMLRWEKRWLALADKYKEEA